MGVLNWYFGRRCVVEHEFISHDRKKEMCVVRFPEDDYPDTYEVVLKSDLRVYEETTFYKRMRDEEAALKQVKDERLKIEQDIKDAVVKSLATRMVLNSLFHKDGKYTEIGVVVGTEIRKLTNDYKIK